MSANRSLRPFSAAAVFAAVIVLLVPAPQVIAGLTPLPAPSVTIASTQAPHRPAIVTASQAGVSKRHPGITPASPKVLPEPIQIAQEDPRRETPATPHSQDAAPKSTYSDRMKAAGYD